MKSRTKISAASVLSKPLLTCMAYTLVGQTFNQDCGHRTDFLPRETVLAFDASEGVVEPHRSRSIN